MEYIEIQNVTKIFGDEKKKNMIVALDDVSLTIREGEFLGIVGESGSGKSTLLNMIGALDTPTKGKVVIGGENIGDYDEKQAAVFRCNNVGFVFQDFLLDEDLNVLQNVEIPMMLKGIDKETRLNKTKEILKILGIEDKLYSPIYELSGGQKQRVSIARALVNNGRLLLADEPTGNLDSVNGRKIVEIMKNLAQSGITVVVVTHNLEEAKSCDRLVELKDGKINSIYEN